MVIKNIEIRHIFTYLKSDLLGGVILFVIFLLSAAPIQFFGYLTFGVFLTTLLAILASKNKGTLLSKKLLFLGRVATLTSLLGSLFFIVPLTLTTAIFSSFKVFTLLTMSLVQSFLVYYLFVEWSLNRDKEKIIDIREYKKALVVVLVIFVLVFILR